MNEKIEIPQDKLVPLIKGVYNRSVPVGMGFCQPFEAELTDDDARKHIHPTGNIAVSMDYVNGRQCKFTVWRDDSGKLWALKDKWYDHSIHALTGLYSELGIV